MGRKNKTSDFWFDVQWWPFVVVFWKLVFVCGRMLVVFGHLWLFVVICWWFVVICFCLLLVCGRLWSFVAVTCFSNYCLINNTTYFYSNPFRKTKYASCKPCLLLIIYIWAYDVISSKWWTLYVFIKKEYLKCQLIRKQRSIYFDVSNIHTSYSGLFNSDYSGRWYWEESRT